jgi:DNA gyrase/topoisomerase IV subunit B
MSLNPTVQEAARSVKRATRSNESKVKAIPKLEDANLAGGKLGHECTLIVTEGDSAKALAIAGLAVVGRDRFVREDNNHANIVPLSYLNYSRITLLATCVAFQVRCLSSPWEASECA